MDDPHHPNVRPDIPTPEEAMTRDRGPAQPPPAPTPVPPAAESVVVIGGEAPLGSRIGAFLIDAVIVMLLFAIVGRISGLLAPIVGFGYLLTRDSLPFLNGESIGKKALKIKAVGEDGKSLSGDWGPGLVRNVVLLIPFFPLVELIVLLVRSGTPQGLRRLGDEWARTRVIRVG
jgi:uncharacterized RDD family membrane protein YckC